MADPQDDFDPDFEPEAAASTGDDFDPDYEPPAIVADASEPAVERPWYEDLALGAVDGLTLNNAGEIGKLGESLGNLAADEMDLLTGRNEIDGMAPTKSGESDGDWEALYDLARESTPGKIGHGLGLVNSGAALSSLAPTTVLGQAAAGGASGALATGGDTDYDPLSMLVGGATGAALGGVGGALGKGVDAIRNWLGSAAPGGAQMALPGMAPKLTNAERIAEKFSVSLDDLINEGVLKSGRKLLAQGAAKGAMAIPGQLPRGVAGAMAASGPQAFTGLADTGTSHAQDVAPWSVEIGEAQPLTDYEVDIGEAQIQEKAYAGQPALLYGVQTVLASGRSGLPAKAERDLTSALLAGDDDKFSAANFKAQQRFPAYAKRLQDELNSLSEDIP